MSCTVLNLESPATVESGVLPYHRPRHVTGRLPINILLAEDNASDIELTQEALDAAAIAYELHTLHNGAEVLPYLTGQRQYRDQDMPDVLLLDLSLPVKDGFEVLAELANAGYFSDLPVVILTGDARCAFLKKSYDLNIVAYLTKPCSTDKIHAAIAAIRKGG